MNMSIEKFLLYVAVMAGVTYLIRMLPLVIFKKKIQSRFIKSFLFYVPYAVLAAMTIPDIFFSTGNVWSAVAGLVVAVILAYFEKGLLTVALCACGGVLVVESLLKLL
ncbi:AzlD domain-containing protein [Clostridium sp. NSJ-27]|uniref:AzlD domain-containing protein n=2 Tax=Eubacteriales TaxID=186802 RepID=A0ABR7IQ91_9CLOT|nr:MULTISPECIES: AzlD domain-containing protein [Clostridiaceae]MBC5787301.1 AzlD domain-containing protein [Clostridium facile]